MVPAPLFTRNANTHATKLLYPLLSLGIQCLSRLLGLGAGSATQQETGPLHMHAKRAMDEKVLRTVFAILMPVLVLLSGVFAGLTLGYMSLDETQLSVLSISGTPQQREYANKIKPIRKNGHLLLVTLLLANMIVNETLPVISTPVLGGGILGVLVSTVLIIIFAEIIPQSLCTRHGLYLGAKMAPFTKILIIVLGVVAWPVAKLLEWVLGPHHGIIYRRAELKELIALHSSDSPHGGDLKIDTVTIIGATLDLQEKVVKQAMTPIEDVFMLSIDSKLDYDLLKKIVQTGHSRVPVYEEIDMPVPTKKGVPSTQTQKMKKILGILLVKQCVLLDPKDATPLRKIPLNKVPFVPNNEPLLGILDKFQEGRSHMAIVSRFSVDKAMSVKKAAKRSLTQRLRERVMGDTDSDSSDGDGDEEKALEGTGNKIQISLSKSHSKEAEEATLREDADGPHEEHEFGTLGQKVTTRPRFKSSAGSASARGRKHHRSHSHSNSNSRTRGEKDAVEMDEMALDNGKKPNSSTPHSSFQLPRLAAASMASISNLEQNMPADAVLNKEGAEEFLRNFDPAIMPLGIITLEDVLEELIGEEIYDEFDPQGARGDPYQVPPETKVEFPTGTGTIAAPTAAPATATAPIEAGSGPAPGPEPATIVKPAPLYMPTALKNLTGLGLSGFLRPKSAPPVPRDPETEKVPTPMPMPMPVAASIPPSPQPQVPLGEDGPQGTVVGTGARAGAGAERRPSLPSGQSAPASQHGHGHAGHASVDSTRPSTAHSVGGGAPVALPLEAVLLERKRRLAAGGGSIGGGNGGAIPGVGVGVGVQAVPVEPMAGVGVQGGVGGVGVGGGGGVGPGPGLQATRSMIVPGPKGTRFKSSPLVEGEVAVPVVVKPGEEGPGAAE